MFKAQRESVESQAQRVGRELCLEPNTQTIHITGCTPSCLSLFLFLTLLQHGNL
jgi:hypothetical protein